MLTFLISAGLIAYVLAGYPAALGLIARRRGRPVRRSTELPAISVVIPVHNGGRFLRRKLESVLNADYPTEKLQVLIMLDGCTDTSEGIAREYFDHNVRFISLPRSGKPAALNAAALQATGEIMVFTDVRQDLHPDALRKLVGPFCEPGIGVVSGELILRTGATQAEADVGLYWRYETWIRRQLSLVDSMFGATGPFYAIRRQLFVPIPNDILLDDMYLPLSVFFKGYRLVVEPEAVAFDYPMTRQREFGRKVRTLGGNYQLLLRMPRLLTPSNRLLWHFLSYKAGRLMLPWLLGALFCSSFRLPRPLNGIAVGAQVFVYSLALLDPLVAQDSFFKKASSPVRTFVVLMAATIMGIKVLFVPPQSLWKVTDIARTDS
jgi:biofilm PGA synthesis N-glycosyltransferase PgaC